MELHAIAYITTPWYCSLHLHAKEHHTFHAVTGPRLQGGASVQGPVRDQDQMQVRGFL